MKLISLVQTSGRAAGGARPPAFVAAVGARIPPRPGRKGIASLLLALVLGLASVMAGGCHRDVDRSLTRAVEAWDAGDYKVAAEEYERYLYQRPTSEKAPDARFQLANIYYFKLQRYDQARVNYQAFLEQHPSHASSQLARERLGEVLGEMGRSYEAIAEYENLNPQDSSERRRIRLRIADLYFAQRNYSQAITEYEKVIEQAAYDELTEQALLREASIYHIERSQYQQALPVYQKLASAGSDSKVRIRAAFGLSECYAGLYQFDEAIKILRTITVPAEQADVTRRLAELELQRREAVQARNGMQEVPARRPQPVAPEPNPETKKQPEPGVQDQKQKPDIRKQAEKPKANGNQQVEKPKPETKRVAKANANGNQSEKPKPEKKRVEKANVNGNQQVEKPKPEKKRVAKANANANQQAERPKANANQQTDKPKSNRKPRKEIPKPDQKAPNP